MARAVSDGFGHARASARSSSVRAEGTSPSVGRELACNLTDPASANADGLLRGHSAAMRDVRERLRLFAPVPWPVRLHGSSGSGKGQAARFLHLCSDRRSGPFVIQSMAGLAEGLEVAQLTGHVAGAFTGAVHDRPGAVENAHGGALFLDEIADASLTAQNVLLHLLEDGCVRRVGESRPRLVDVRMIVATNKNLEEAVEAGRFREDLFHRLGRFVVELPSLRDHKEDIPEIAAALLHRFAAQLGRDVLSLSPAAIDALQAYDWPGNVRELEWVMREYLVLGSLPLLGTGKRMVGGIQACRTRASRAVRARAAVAQHGGDKTAAARSLGISRMSLYRWLKEAKQQPEV